MTFCTFPQQNLLKDYDFWQFCMYVCMSRVCGKLPNRSKIAPGALWKRGFFLKLFQKIDFFKLNNFFKTSESTFPVKNALGRLRSDEKYVSIYLKPHINILLSCYHVFLSEYNIFDLIPQSTSAQFISMTSYVELRNVLDSVKSSTNISELSPIHRN